MFGRSILPSLTKEGETLIGLNLNPGLVRDRLSDINIARLSTIPAREFEVTACHQLIVCAQTIGTGFEQPVARMER
jgi:hypothetical protein